MNHLIEQSICCPYCGESIEVLIDPTDLGQQYIEDCQVCCKPMLLLVSENHNAEIVVDVYAEDESL